jgi:isopenicillin N synthase-like dioxygenase
VFPTLRDFVKDFSIRSHTIARQLLRVFAYNFGVPDSEGGREYFENRHRYDEPSGDHIRWLKVGVMPKFDVAWIVKLTVSHPQYPFRSIEDDAKEGSPVRLGAHTDHGSITLLYSQPIGGLQVWRVDESGQGKFEFVQPLETGSIIINLGDAISFWTDGFLKSTLHRGALMEQVEE